MKQTKKEIVLYCAEYTGLYLSVNSVTADN